MQFKNGYLGAFLVVIAVVMTIAGSYVMSLDMEETTAIKYHDSADLTGLFDAEEAPSYMPFNPSANQTGYYTDRTTKYFDGVQANTTTQPNKYPINMGPNNTFDFDHHSMEDLTSTGDYAIQIFYWPDNGTLKQVRNISMLSLADLITGLNLEVSSPLPLTTYNKIVLTTAETPNYTQSESFITFVTADRLAGGNALAPKTVYMKNPALTGELEVSLGLTRDAAQTPDPILAVEWDKRGTYVNLYYDLERKVPAGVANPDEIYVLWGGTAQAFGNWILGDSINFSGGLYGQQQYFIVTDGVRLEEIA